jgi:hypothetical protein
LGRLPDVRYAQPYFSPSAKENMNEQIKKVAVEETEAWESRALTPEENFLLNWIDQAPERHLRLLTDMLGRAIALATGLAGAAAVFLDDRITHPATRLFAIALFLVALVASAIAIYPSEEKVAYDPEAAKSFMRQSAARKKDGLTIAGVCIFMGLLLLAIGLLIRLINGSTRI